MPSITNKSDIPLALAVWLLHDEYDYIDDENYISVTRLMRPIRHLILPNRIPREERTADVEDFIARASGHAYHDSIEKAWKSGYKRSLALLGYPQNMIDKVLINPNDEQVKLMPGCIPVYLEQRAIRPIEHNGKIYKIGGKFDMVTEGIVNDTKSTSAYGWLYGTRDDENTLQGSLYRWIDANLPMPRITEDFMQVNYVFTDWQKAAARSNPNYPQKKVEKKQLPLLGLNETENFIRNKLTQYERYKNLPESQIPECTDEELWRSEPKYKYYSDPAKTSGRSTKNFDSLSDANQHMASAGKGIVITQPGEVKRCGYCDAFAACTQKDKYFNDQP